MAANVGTSSSPIDNCHSLVAYVLHLVVEEGALDAAGVVVPDTASYIRG
jgi:hypothetical protein